MQSLYRNVGGAVELQPSLSHALSYKMLAEEESFRRGYCVCVRERVCEKVSCDDLFIKLHLKLTQSK